MKKKRSSFSTKNLNSISDFKYNIKPKKEEKIIQQQKEERLNNKIDEENNKILQRQ